VLGAAAVVAVQQELAPARPLSAVTLFLAGLAEVLPGQRQPEGPVVLQSEAATAARATSMLAAEQPEQPEQTAMVAAAEVEWKLAETQARAGTARQQYGGLHKWLHM